MIYICLYIYKISNKTNTKSNQERWIAIKYIVCILFPALHCAKDYVPVDSSAIHWEGVDTAFGGPGDGWEPTEEDFKANKPIILEGTLRNPEDSSIWTLGFSLENVRRAVLDIFDSSGIKKEPSTVSDTVYDRTGIKKEPSTVSDTVYDRTGIKKEPSTVSDTVYDRTGIKKESWTVSDTVYDRTGIKEEPWTVSDTVYDRTGIKKEPWTMSDTVYDRTGIKKEPWTVRTLCTIELV